MLNPKSFVITGTGAVQNLADIIGDVRAKWIQFLASGTATPLSANAECARVGGAEVSSTVGFPLPPGWGGMLYPAVGTPDFSAFYDARQINVYLANGDSLYGLWGG